MGKFYNKIINKAIYQSSPKRIYEISNYSNYYMLTHYLNKLYIYS